MLFLVVYLYLMLGFVMAFWYVNSELKKKEVIPTFGFVVAMIAAWLFWLPVWIKVFVDEYKEKKN